MADPDNGDPGAVVLKKLADVLEAFYLHDILTILKHDNENCHFGLTIKPFDLYREMPEFAEFFMEEPIEALLLLTKAIMQAQFQISSSPTQLGAADLPFTVKHNVHARLGYMPRAVAEHNRSNISMIRSSDVGLFLQVSGTVIRTGTIKMLEWKKTYECTNAKCRFQFQSIADVERDNIIEMPTVCPSPKKPGCKSTTFVYVEDSRECIDYQEIKIQEQVQSLTVGSIPRSIVVVLENDLVDTCKAGDDVVVSGILTRRWGRVARGARFDTEVVFRANHIRLNNATVTTGVLTEDMEAEFRAFWALHTEDRMAARNLILRSVCPQVFGLYIVKLSLLLTMIGGVGYLDPSGLKIRGESHMLMIGDPGTGKSQFLRYAASLSPRSVLTTGIGTTSAGLTCTAVKDNGEWMLEAGALVLADRGVCCIDEFGQIREHDRTTIHEAMEQQTLSVAKAGLVCKLNARATVIASCNPKGKYDVNADVSVNTSIASPLLSRFDIVLVLLDTPNAEWDHTVSTFILETACKRRRGGGASQAEGGSAFATPAVPASAVPPSGPATIGQEPWGFEKLKAYILYVKSNFQPVLTPAAEKVLTKYYTLQRHADMRQVARTTIRLLESSIRIAQAHARLMFRQEVLLQDAVVAVILIETSMHTATMLGVDSVLHSAFPEDADAEYATQEAVILRRLGLSFDGSDGGGDGGGGRREEPRPRDVSQPPGNVTFSVESRLLPQPGPGLQRPRDRHASGAPSVPSPPPPPVREVEVEEGPRRARADTAAFRVEGEEGEEDDEEEFGAPAVGKKRAAVPLSQAQAVRGGAANALRRAAGVSRGPSAPVGVPSSQSIRRPPPAPQPRPAPAPRLPRAPTPSQHSVDVTGLPAVVPIMPRHMYSPPRPTISPSGPPAHFGSQGRPSMPPPAHYHRPPTPATPGTPTGARFPPTFQPTSGGARPRNILPPPAPAPPPIVPRSYRERGGRFDEL